MILHNSAEPEVEHAVRETTAGDIAGGAGALAFNALLAMIALRLVRRLPFPPLEILLSRVAAGPPLPAGLFGLVPFYQSLVDLPAGVAPTPAWLPNGFGAVGLVARVPTEFLAPLVLALSGAVLGMTGA